jgi:hypothetical protein
MYISIIYVDLSSFTKTIFFVVYVKNRKFIL